ncbi:DnaB-like helicase C-terminal domain-containing protein [Rhodopirellula sp. MGV]|uniref:DnaB-like helicase C-terminal domain-containing protein n=1 Tax=Rhodopirellula sp. MGV TaxID=2023130 RepID=UPI000B95DCF4|nr:DnaB-like helicase C-terminal domain-containing protein [Rhodopirellula sp. MGV]OYP34136.1 hypothetical protein CGZ80_15865 [Rhodopirellula sp. MGV]PNY33572.1 hypothetical protein C2E31_27590 [Rhodopirellula baltica]
MAGAIAESSRITAIDAPWDYYADDLLLSVTHRIENVIRLEQSKDEPSFLASQTFDRIVKLYFQAFDMALSRGAGVVSLGDRLHTSDGEIQGRLESFEDHFQLGGGILSLWHEERGTKLAQSEFLSNGADLLDDVVNGMLAGKADALFDCGEALEDIEIGPGLLTIIGAPPGRGKTALALQAVYEAVSRQDGLQAVVASLEVSPATLLKRRLAALLGVSFDSIRFNRLTESQRQKLLKLDDFRRTLQSVGFLKPERSGLGDLETMLQEFDRPGLLLMDYIQLFGAESATAAERGAATMATARRFCERGWAVVGVSAVARASYGKGGVGSFRDTSAVEYSGTSCYLLEEATEYEDEDNKPAVRDMVLRCLKNRNGALKSIPLTFDGPQMKFSRQLNFSPELEKWNGTDNEGF